MRVIFYDHTDRLRHGNTEPTASLHELLAQSDVVSLHVPETPATNGMIGRQEIRAIKKGAYFINTSRGEVVDQDALIECLRERRIAGDSRRGAHPDPRPALAGPRCGCRSPIAR